jgi:hypothetical protein
MAVNPLAVTQSGMDIPGMNTRPYPTLGPAQGGIGPGAPGDPGGEMPTEEKPDNVASLARLMAIMGITPGNPEEAGKIQGFLMGMGLPSAKRIADQGRSRGITDEQSGVQGPPPEPPMPPGMSATPMPPSGMM